MLPLANFILAGICSWHATKIGEFFLPTIEGLKENLELIDKKQEKESEIHWMTEKLVGSEMNCPFILMKSNWLAAAYQHFLLGILLIVIFFAIIIFEPYFMHV
jgi:nitrate reductase gamma subunit